MEIIQYRIFQKIRDCARVFGYHNKFTIQGIEFEVDPSSVGKTPLGETTATGAVEMIKEKGLNNLNVLDIGCGVGIIGLTMFTRLFPAKTIVEMSFADINFFNLNSLERTLRLNNLNSHLGERIHLYLSDVFKQIPQENQFDLIVSNPPDFSINSFDDVNLSGTSLGRYSPDWHFHRDVYRYGHQYLAEDGEIWFLENREAIPEEKLKSFIDANNSLDLVEIKPHSDRPFLYWSIVKRI